MRGLLLLSALLSTPAWARPVILPLQGQLTDVAGVPIDGVVGVTFRLYGDPTPNLTMHSEHLDVDLVTGAFTVYLGSNELLDSSLFNLDQDVWLGIQVDGDIEMELVRVGWTPLAAYAAHAADAETLDGYGSADFLAASWRPSWGDITGRPPGLDDGDDVGSGGTSWTIGAGLLQTGDELSVDPAAVYGWAEQVCYDSVTELRQSLDAVYHPATWRPTWADVSDKPAGFADDLDNDTQYSAGDGLSLAGTTFSADWAAVDVRVRQIAYDTEAELHTALDDEYKAASYVPAWSELSGVPAGFADGQDDGGPTYVAGDGIVIVGSTISAAPASIDTPAEVVAAADPSFIDPDELEAALAPYATEDEVDAAVTAASANDARVEALEAQLQAALAAIDALTDRVVATETQNAGQETRIGAAEAANGTQDTRLAAAEAALEAQEARLAAVEAANAALLAEQAALQAANAALEARVAQIEADAVWYIPESVVYDIPGDFDTLADALAWLARYRISDDAVVTLQLGAGTHTFEETLYIDHPNANNIEIVGDVAAPSSVVLEAAPGSAAEAGLLHVGRGIYLGAVRGLTLVSSNAAVGNALYAYDNGGIGVAEAVRVEGFLYAGQAATGGSLNTPGIVVTGSGNGVLANFGGYVRADSARITMATNTGGVGLYAATGSTLVAVNARTTNGSHGALATRGSVVYIDDTIVTGPGSNGVYSQYGSHVRAEGVTVTGMAAGSGNGFIALYGSSMSAGQSTLSSAVDYGYRSGYSSTIIASYAIANRADVYNTFYTDYGSSMYVPYATARSSHIGYYAAASAMNALNTSVTGGDYGYYGFANGYIEASDSVSSSPANYGFWSGYGAYVDRTGSGGTTFPAAGATTGTNSNNFFSYLR